MATHRALFAAAIVVTSWNAAASFAADDGGGYIGAVALELDPAGNRVLEPNETAVMAPTWGNYFLDPHALQGVTYIFTGPPGAVYTQLDSQADYGTLGPFSSQSCLVTGNCYSLRVDAATRPAVHWDSTIREEVNATTPPGSMVTWKLHVGASFVDVPPTSGFYRFVETILHKNVTGGCGPSSYCPASPTTREQMPVFVLVSREAAGYLPPACGAIPMFADVPVSSPYCRWIEELARRGVVGGCAPGLYCPSSPATREEMAVFVLRTAGWLNPPACGTPMFADVPASSPYCRWIEELVRQGVVSGCGGGNYCPTAPVSREEMAVFLSVTFRMKLYWI